ncbi:MAG: hypothetical protein APR54_08070 [Candidatus Cloacimonas sp. SDB]|nr:MAG: hypothetical protein APR54_08070 [Candidatus Cloacimonas sp. SDB]
MPLKIQAITNDSIASNMMLKSGDTIISINGHPINDFIDLQFYGAEEELEILVSQTTGLKKINVKQDWTHTLGIQPVVHKCTECINNCIFCFVDQIEPGFRKTLYIKDDDYRLSFTYGNFITLTNITSRQMKRIYQQKLSPLYVSVHTTNPQLHKRIMRYPIEFNIYEKLQELVKHNIKLHTQIVVIPEWNDKTELKRTLNELNKLGNGICSVGIVPVGLTRSREYLTPLRSVTSAEAEEIIQIAAKFERTYCADELFILAEQDIPEADYYDDYPQLENGIGMLRLLLENWQINKTDFLNYLSKLQEKLVFVTGSSAYPLINKISAEINRSLAAKTRTVKVINNVFGSTVTVAGLLTAKDIKEQVKLEPHEILTVSSNLFNDDLLTLDNFSRLEIKKHYNNKLLLIDEEFADWALI